MTAQQAALDAETPHSPAAQPVADHTAYYIAVMNDFVAMGSELAHDTIRQSKLRTEALEAGTGHVPPDPSISFERIGRTVRRSIMLADQLAKPAPTADARQRIAARKRIIRQVEDAIQCNAEGAEAESLEAEFLDRLDSPEFADDIDSRPIPEIIAEICCDLGLAAMPGTQPWKRRTPADVAALCALAVRPYRAPSGGAGSGPVAGGAARNDPERDDRDRDEPDRNGEDWRDPAKPGPARADRYRPSADWPGAAPSKRSGADADDPGRSDPDPVGSAVAEPSLGTAAEPDLVLSAANRAEPVRLDLHRSDPVRLDLHRPGPVRSDPPRADLHRPPSDPARPAGVPAAAPLHGGAAIAPKPNPVRPGAAFPHAPPWTLGR